MFVSHLISSILHICFYFYSQQNAVAGIIATLLTPTLSYLTLLAFVYCIFSHFILKEINFDFIGSYTDLVLYMYVAAACILRRRASL
jgi:hypothetical protein